MPENKRVSPLAYLKRKLAEREAGGEEELTDEKLYAANTVKDRLLYILAETMGADGEFGRRREVRRWRVTGVRTGVRPGVTAAKRE